MAMLQQLTEISRIDPQGSPCQPSSSYERQSSSSGSRPARRADLSTREGHRAVGLIVDETRSVTDYTGYPEII
jgi:hypothetical protein